MTQRKDYRSALVVELAIAIGEVAGLPNAAEYLRLRGVSENVAVRVLIIGRIRRLRQRWTERE